jgi:4-hydroxybenzoyl-CoA reductase beta subunit
MERVLDCEVKRPRSLSEAAAILAAMPKARLLAGGTDLVPNLRRGIERPPVLVDLSSVQDLDAIVENEEGLALGAGVTLARIAGDPRVGAACPALAAAARSVAGPAHRSAATLGGNLCLDTRCVFYNQSEWWRQANGFCLKRGGDVCHVAPQGRQCHAAFCGDLAPVLLVLDARADLVASGGVRHIALADFYREDGAAHLALAPGEILARVVIPASASALAAGYRKSRVRGSLDFPLAGVACALALDGGRVRTLRVALTGTNARPVLLTGTDALVGQAVDNAALQALGKLVQKQASPMRTTATPANYRRQVAAVLAQRLLGELAGRAAETTTLTAGTSASEAAPVPLTRNAAEVLLAGGTPSHVALECGDERITYAALRDAVARAASVLRRSWIGRGDRVAVMLPDGIDWVVGMLGTIWAGGVAVGVNPRIPEAEWSAILGDADFRCIIAQTRDDTPSAFRGRIVLLDKWRHDVASAQPVPPEQVDEMAAALWVHSSGTSGRPKAVVHPHRVARRVERVGVETFGITAVDRLFASSKLFFAYPQTNALYTGLKTGATIILDPQWPTAAGVAATIAARRPSVVFSVPALYRSLLKEGHAKAVAASGVRLCVSAGEALSSSLRDEWRRATGLTIADGYGASETMTLVLINRGDGPWSTPSPGVTVEALHGAVAGAGTLTRLRIRAPALASGYWHRPDAEAASFDHGTFTPADLFEANGEGGWRFAGREDSLVKIHGRWVDLADIGERLMFAVHGVAEGAAVAVPDADGVDAVAFFYVEAADAPAELKAQLATFAQSLPAFQRPHFLHAIKALPRTATGKLIRRQLVELHRALA